MLKNNTDYVICHKAGFIDSKSPMKIGRGICLSTKNYLFYLPTSTIGTYPLLQTYKTHVHFEGVSVEEGVKKIIESSATTEELEESLTALLESNPRNIHHIPSYKQFVISGFFVKNNMRLINSRFDFQACVLKPKTVAKEFRDFHGK